MTYGLRAAGLWKDERESNLLDGRAPNYGVYRCSDGRFLAVGAIEPQFREALFAGLGLDPGAGQEDIANVLSTRSRDDWVSHFAGRDACVAPVLDLGEAPHHPQNVHRGTFVDVDGVTQPGPAPRYSRTQCNPPTGPREEGADGAAILGDLGYSAEEVGELRSKGVLQ